MNRAPKVKYSNVMLLAKLSGKRTETKLQAKGWYPFVCSTENTETYLLFVYPESNHDMIWLFHVIWGLFGIGKLSFRILTISVG